MFLLLFLQIIQGENEEKYEGFKLLNSEGLLNFTHVKSGCHIIFQKENHEKMEVNIGLYTPSKNNHGIPHIIEHLLTDRTTRPS